MTNFTNASAQRLARLLVGLKKEKREKVVQCLDVDFRVCVIKEIGVLLQDMPLEIQDTTPPGKIPNCS